MMHTKCQKQAFGRWLDTMQQVHGAGENHIHNVLILAKGEPLTVQGNTYIHYRELQRTSRSFSIKQAKEIVFITLLPLPLQILPGAGET